MSAIPQDILEQVTAINGCEGVLFTGSRQQGAATDSSDWDFYVLLEDGFDSFRQTWPYNGSFIEVFCNTLQSINDNELVTDKISNAAVLMLATGTIVLDKHGRLKDVQKRAKELYEPGPPPPDKEEILLIAYTLRAYVDDLKSLEELDLDGYFLQLKALVYAVECFYKLEQHWMASPRAIEKDIEQIDKDWASMHLRCNQSTGAQRTKAIINLIESLASKHGLSLSGEIMQVRDTK